MPDELTMASIERLDCSAIDAKPEDFDWSEHLGEDLDGWTSYEAHEVEVDLDPSYVSEWFAMESWEQTDHLEELKERRILTGEPENSDPTKLERINDILTRAFEGEIDDSEIPEHFATLQEKGVFDGWHREEAIVGFASAEDSTGEEHRDYFDGPMMNYRYPIPGLRDSIEAALKLVNLPLCVVETDDGTYLALTGGGMDLSWEICEAYIRLGFSPPAHFCDLPRMAGRGQSDEDKIIIAACRRSLEILRGWMDSRLARLDALSREDG